MEPPTSCPLCQHDLPTSPVGQCPNCIFAYDPHTCVWRHDLPWVRHGMGYTAVGLLAGVGLVLLYHAELKRSAYAMLPLILAVGVPLLGLLFQRVIGGRLTGRLAAVTPTGLLLRTRAEPTLIPWHDFDRLTTQRGVLKVQRFSNPALLPLDDIFTSGAEVAAFEAAVKDAVRRARLNPRAISPETPAPPE